MEQMTKKAFKVSYSPLSSLVMQAIMLWLTGSSVGYINIMLCAMLMGNFISTVSKINSAFEEFETELQPGMIRVFKVIYLICSCAILGIALYKFNSMGILPNRPADYLPALKERIVCFICL